MKINEMIRERRIAKKLTQEQMAGYLGVTAPAVNKWEKGTSYPDITLLPALARLLDTDLNTLLSFQEDLSDREIALFLNELSELSERGVETLYVRALDSSDSAIQNQAKAMLISRYMGRKEYERAQELLNSLPEQDFFDKKQIQVNLLIELGKLGEAAKAAEEKLLSATNEIHATLMSLMEIAIKEDRIDDAEYIANVSKKGADLFDLWEYNSYVAHFQLYLVTKQRKKVLKILVSMLKSLTHKWEINQSPLYRHIKTKEVDKTFGPKMQKTLIDSLRHDEDSAYWRENQELEKVLEEFEIKGKKK
ncbi:MAG: helix-turn-helix domain-containing protein [Coprococcus sp.]